MASVKDAKGQPWDFHLTVASLRRIREATGRNLYNLWEKTGEGKPTLAVEVQYDDGLTLELLYHACRAKAAERKVADLDTFLDLFDGESIAAAVGAFREELILFFRQSGRADLVDLLAAAREQIKASVAVVTAAAKMLRNDAGNSPEPSASTPAPGPSASSNG